ncbi:MAG: sigma-70 family RNA polymerase sigma factor [Blastocatellia bacterium]
MVEGNTYSTEPKVIESPIETLLRDIPAIVRLSYSLRDSHPSKDLVEDLSQEILLLLIEDDYRRLRSFDVQRSSFKTWLSAVVMHHVSRHVSKEKYWKPMDEVAPEELIYLPTQELELAYDEEAKRVRAALAQLTEREKQLFSLLCQDGVKVEQIAREMGVKIESVYRRKHGIIKKLQELLGFECQRFLAVRVSDQDSQPRRL